MSNEFSEMVDADPKMVLMAQQEMLRRAIMRAIMCPVSGVVLDQRRAVLVIPSNGGGLVMTADVWEDKREAVTAAAEASGVTLEIYDGRELFA